ncbi:MAG: PGF-pre-PGF domain-containing protein, partial [Candidatus Aenigmarchaeota archaeon]|nr:PGF-pre-PGF domain-containing protein [Candidatus Aenigmarchaeota archaeon]
GLYNISASAYNLSNGIVTASHYFPWYVGCAITTYLNSSPTSITKSIFPGITVYQNITLSMDACNGTRTVTMSKPGTLPDTWISFSPGTVIVPTYSTNYTQVSILAPSGTGAGNYSTNIFANKSDNYSVTIPVNITVSSSYTFDVTVVVPSTHKTLTAGSSVTATVTITKLAGPAGSIDVNITYKIKNPSSTTIDQRTEQVAIETTVQRAPIFTVPTGSPDGLYTFEASVFKDVSTTSSDSFTLSTPGPAASPGGGSSGGGGSSTAPATEDAKPIPPAATTTPQSIIFKETLPVSEVEIKLSSAAPNAEIRVSTRTAPASGPFVVSPSAGSVYSYLEIKAQNVDNSRIEHAKIRFKVERAWVASEEIDVDTVRLAKLVDNSWVSLASTKTGEDSRFIYYEAETPGFSTYAIFGEKVNNFKMEISDYPDIIETVQGDTKQFFVGITNKGNKTLTKIKPSLTDIPDGWYRFSPASLDYMDPGSGAVFVGTITVPSGPVVNKSIDIVSTLRAQSSEVTAEKHTVIRILTSVFLKESLDYTQAFADKLWLRMVDDRSRGLDTETASVILRDVNTKLSQAQIFYQENNYTAANTLLGESKALIENAAIALQGVEFPKSPKIQLNVFVIVFVVIAALAAAALLLHSRAQRRRMSYSVLRESLFGRR